MQTTSTPSPSEEGTPSAQGFLQRALAAQSANIAAYDWADERVWIKKAGPRNPAWRYRVLGGVARLLGLGVLRPVPNLGGERAIAIERARLRSLAELDLPVPLILAACDSGLMLRDLAYPAQTSVSLAVEIGQAGDSTRRLKLFQEGLQAVARVHAAGSCLSQAFARNLVRTADGRLGYIDFEDDPAELLSPDECQARDWLCYLHSTAQPLREVGALEAGAGRASDLLQARPLAVRRLLASAASRLRWLRRLPADRRFGGDSQRVQAAALLLDRLELHI